jgi:rRNA maturation RNase YbeY
MITFSTEDVSFTVPFPIKTRRWLRSVITDQGLGLNHLNYVFCSDEFLLQMNKEYLNHDYYTDILTFDSSDEENTIEGDIFISIDRAADNAVQFGVSFESELRRLLVHGVLHLSGQSDETDEEEAEMRRLEDHYLATF